MNNNDIEILDANTMDAINELKEEGYTTDEIKQTLTENESNAYQKKIEEGEFTKKLVDDIINQHTIGSNPKLRKVIREVTGINRNYELPTEQTSAFNDLTDRAFARMDSLDQNTREKIEKLEQEGYTEDEIKETLTDVERSLYNGEKENKNREDIIKTSIMDAKNESTMDRIEKVTGVKKANYDKVTPQNSAFANMSDFDFNDFLQTDKEKERVETEAEKAEKLIEKRQKEEEEKRRELNAFSKEELIDKIMKGEFTTNKIPVESFKITYAQDDPVEYMENRMKHDWENKSAFATMSDKEFERKFGKVDSDIKEVNTNYKFDNFEDLSKTIYKTIDKEAEIDNKFKFDRTKLKVGNESLLRKLFIGGYDLGKNAFTEIYEKSSIAKTWIKKENILKDEDKFLMPNEDSQNMKFGNYVNITDLKNSLKEFYQNNKFKTYKVRNENGKVVKYRLAKKQLTDFIDKLGDCYTIVKNNENKKEEQYVSVEDAIKNMPNMFRKTTAWIDDLVDLARTKLKKAEENILILDDVHVKDDTTKAKVNLSEKEQDAISITNDNEKTGDLYTEDKKKNNITFFSDEAVQDTVIIENGKTYIITEDGEKKEYIPKEKIENKNSSVEDEKKKQETPIINEPNIEEDDKLLVDFSSLTNKEIEPLDRETDKLPLMNWEEVMQHYKTPSPKKEPVMDLDMIIEQANNYMANFGDNNSFSESVGGMKK